MSKHPAILRDQFTQAEIAEAYREGGSFQKAAKILTSLGRGHISRQLARHWCNNLDSTELPEEIHRGEEVVRTRNQQVANTKLRKDLRSVIGIVEKQRDIMDGLHNAIDEIKNRSPVQYRESLGKPDGTPCTVEMLLSDLQIGKRGNGYDTPTARARLFEYGRAAVHQIKQKIIGGYRVERIVLAVLGDIIESDKKHKNSARATDTGTAEQMHDATVGLFEFVIEPLARLGIKMDVYTVGGNHDWDDHGMAMYKPGKELLSYPIYKTLEFISRQAGYKHVEFNVPDGVYSIAEIYGEKVLYEHGVGVSVTEQSMKAHKIKRSEQIKDYIQYFRMG